MKAVAAQDCAHDGRCGGGKASAACLAMSGRTSFQHRLSRRLRPCHNVRCNHASKKPLLAARVSGHVLADQMSVNRRPPCQVHKAAPPAPAAFHDLKISGGGELVGTGGVRLFCQLLQLAGVHEFEKEKKKKKNWAQRRRQRVEPPNQFWKIGCLTARGRARQDSAKKRNLRLGERPHQATRSLDPDLVIALSSSSAIISSTLAWVAFMCVLRQSKAVRPKKKRWLEAFGMNRFQHRALGSALFRLT